MSGGSEHCPVVPSLEVAHGATCSATVKIHAAASPGFARRSSGFQHFPPQSGTGQCHIGSERAGGRVSALPAADQRRSVPHWLCHAAVEAVLLFVGTLGLGCCIVQCCLFNANAPRFFCCITNLSTLFILQSPHARIVWAHARSWRDRNGSLMHASDCLSGNRASAASMAPGLCWRVPCFYCSLVRFFLQLDHHVVGRRVDLVEQDFTLVSYFGDHGTETTLVQSNNCQR